MSPSRGDDGPWPSPAFRCRVNLGDDALGLVRVSGLEAVADPPSGRVQLSRGVFGGELTLWRWFEECCADPEATRTITIDLLDADGTISRRWWLDGARAVRMTGPELDATANAAAIETLEVVCARISTSVGPRRSRPDHD